MRLRDPQKGLLPLVGQDAGDMEPLVALREPPKAYLVFTLFAVTAVVVVAVVAEVLVALVLGRLVVLAARLGVGDLVRLVGHLQHP